MDRRLGRVLCPLHARQLLNAREVLAEREDELEQDYTDFLNRENEADDGTLRFRGEYLLSVV